jgi:hypothetical protein
VGPFDLAAVLGDAQRKESLTDWGPGDFEHPLGVLLDDYAAADLNVVGVHILRAGRYSRRRRDSRANVAAGLRRYSRLSRDSRANVAAGLRRYSRLSRDSTNRSSSS